MSIDEDFQKIVKDSPLIDPARCGALCAALCRRAEMRFCNFHSNHCMNRKDCLCF